MKLRRTNRRAFIRDSFAVAATAALLKPGPVLLGRASAAEPKVQSIRLGGPSFAKTDDPEALALAHRTLGYRAAYCPGVALKDTEAIGARCCVDIAGSFNPTSWFGPHPDNLSQKFFDAAVENARKIIDAVNPKRTRFTYEAMGWALPDSPDNYVKLIKAVNRPAFGVHLDPCNLVNSPDKFYHNTALLNECFDKLGRWIVSCHAKDLTWDVEMNVHFREVAPGKGSLDYATYLKRVAELPQNPPLMLEHLATAEEYAGAREHIFGVGRKAALSFG